MYFLQHTDEVALDYYNQIVLNLYKVKRDEVVIDLKRKKVFFDETGSEPCAIHGSLDKHLYKEIRELFYGGKRSIS